MADQPHDENGPAETGPPPVRDCAFAENQPFTPIIDTLRGLLLGTAIGDSAWIAVAWCVGLSLAGYLWARSAYKRPGHAVLTPVLR